MAKLKSAKSTSKPIDLPISKTPEKLFRSHYQMTGLKRLEAKIITYLNQCQNAAAILVLSKLDHKLYQKFIATHDHYNLLYVNIIYRTGGLRSI